MVQEALVFTCINWPAIARRDWELVLDSIPVGECVEDIPFEALEHLPRVRILKLKREPTGSVDLHRVDVEYDEMVFAKVRTRGGGFIWRRER